VKPSFIALAVVPCLLGCIELDDLARPSNVDRPRVLAVVAEPPEINPGSDVELRVMVAGVDDYTVSWSACGVFSSMGGGSQYNDIPDREGCGGDLTVALGEGDVGVLPGDLSSALFLDLELAADVLGAVLPEGTVEAVRSGVGIPVVVEATVETGDQTLRAIKRVLISEQSTPHTNPPPPHFDIDGIEIIAAPDEPFTCVAADGEAVRVPADSEVELAPHVDGDEEPWLERYMIIDARGMTDTRDEAAFYSWFSDGGRLSEEVTKSPLRNELWETPKAPGCYNLWLVVRDGHGGQSACRLPVAVGDRDCH
jgi:hypothetical protein